MWVFGDRSRRVRPRQALRALTATLREVESASSGAERHDRLTAAFLQAGELAQGIADAEFRAKGEDDASPAQEAALALLVALARKLAASAWSGFVSIGPPSSAELMALALSPMPDEVELKTPEGHAFYAVLPEAYLKAAAEKPWDSPPLVIGVRSIGAGLAALTAAVTHAEKVVTLRPTGHPFRREVRVSDGLKRSLAAHRGLYAVVDEGPGMSGSSFGAIGDLLDELGVEPERIVFLPSHDGEPGAEALPEHRARWAQAIKRPATFEALVEDEPLAGWFEDLTGPISQIEDLSDGAWAKARGDQPPIHPLLERRKFRLTAETGAWLAKFAGLGALGEAKFARSRTLFRAGAGAEPLGLRRGFLLERWVEGAPGPQVNREGLVEHVGRYLGLRALAFPAEAEDGASLEDLAVMTRVNVAELKGQAAADALPAPPMRAKPRPIHVDGRLHRWEWITTRDERLIKTDALDHSCGHDLVGCQDVAWDVAGARIELDLDEAEVERLIAAVAQVSDRPVDRDLLAFFDLAYPAFQAGLWTLAGNEAQVARYAARLP
ncbi:hypothetical protein [Phenylobacterium sp.]|uniref:hypothetical protein n=1 Tax=Phenylobacterium sp. TaxID=1871053 RepID=UPI002DE8B4E0|nr:hypothetical protein [Phenylobacterium sp.]